MQKIYILLAAAMCASSAYAAPKDVSVAKSPAQLNILPKVEHPTTAKAQVVTNMPKKTTRAGSNTSYLNYFPAESIMNFGITKEGAYYQMLGFSSSYGDLVFHNHSVGFEDFEWGYSIWRPGESDFTARYSAEKDLTVEAFLGDISSPQLIAYSEGLPQTYNYNTRYYYMGGSAGYWSGDYEQSGLTFYKNMGYKTVGGNMYFYTPRTAYRPNEDDFNVGGVNEDAWQGILSEAFPDMDVADPEIENFTIMCPKTNSPYIMSQGWIYMMVDASSDTELTSYIYPVDEDGTIDYEHPIAFGTADVSKRGTTDFPLFNYQPLNQDGDIVDDMIIIDTAVAITIEGFLGNPYIKYVIPQSGMYPFDYDLYVGVDSEPNHGLIPAGDLYVKMNLTVDGEPTTALLTDKYIYSIDSYGNYSKLNYSVWTMDAAFPFIYSLDDEEEVLFPEEGGESEVVLNSYFYQVKANVEVGNFSVEAPEWLNVEFSEPDYDNTGYTTMTLTADKAEAPREGHLRISGMASNYDLVVKQDCETGVSAVNAADGAVYYDLMGRRVMNPEKGVYIVKEGKRTYKTVK